MHKCKTILSNFKIYNFSDSSPFSIKMKNNNQGAIQHSLLVQVQITILCIDILNVRAHFECLIMAGSDFGEINFGKTKSVKICAGEGIVPYLVSQGMIYENVKY